MTTRTSDVEMRRAALAEPEMWFDEEQDARRVVRTAELVREAAHQLLSTRQRPTCVGRQPRA